MLALDFEIDPTAPVPRAVFTGDHRRIEGCGEVLEPPFERAGVSVTAHPSGFAPGARQLRVAAAGETWVFTGDFKRSKDPLGAAFEPVPCDVLVLRAPFALPIFRWEEVAALRAWLEANERCTLFASPVLALRLQAQLAVPLRRHEDLEPLALRYDALGAKVPASDPSSERLLAPLAARASVKRRGPRAIADGSARIRGTRRRANVDMGFALSEHADWEEVLATVADSKARRVLVQGSHAEALARFLREERGLESAPA